MLVCSASVQPSGSHNKPVQLRTREKQTELADT